MTVWGTCSRGLNVAMVFSWIKWCALINCIILIMWVLMESSFLWYYRSILKLVVILIGLTASFSITWWWFEYTFDGCLLIIFGIISIHIYIYIENYEKEIKRSIVMIQIVQLFLSLYRRRWPILSSKWFNKDLLTVLKF